MNGDFIRYMKFNKTLIFFSWTLIPFFLGILFLDLAGSFSYSDWAFGLGFGIYSVIVLIQNASSEVTFTIALLLVLFMGLSYVPTGASVITERLGEWFYLFFVFGLLQSLKHELFNHSAPGKHTQVEVDWDAYYSGRLRSLHSHMCWYASWLHYIDTKTSLFTRRLRVFEIGSGSGGVLMLLHRKGVSVTGSDISKKAQAVFRKFNDRIPYELYDIQGAVSRRGSFDRVIAFEVLEHIKHLDRAVENIKKMLRPGGVFIGSTPPDSKNFDPTHINVHEPEYWKQMFEKHGFSRVATYAMSFPPVLWRLHPKLNIVIPFDVTLPGWISTTLIIARK
jgi:2-polyprenyl-3-methyl-5-hydroxy-6-metoxy-1,4-benzoquinol methylase